MKIQTMNIALSPELARFVREKVESGLYSTASEVIGEALRLFSQAKGGSAEALLVDTLELQEARIDRTKARDAIDTLFRLREGTTLGNDLTVRDLIDEGRR